MSSTKSKVDAKIIVGGIFGGLLVGAINGFFGGGGGMVVVPLLIYFFCLKDKKSHATAIFIMLPISIASAIVYCIKIKIRFDLVLFVGFGFVAGGLLGAFLLKKLNNKVIRIIFSIIMILAGIKMII